MAMLLRHVMSTISWKLLAWYSKRFCYLLGSRAHELVTWSTAAVMSQASGNIKVSTSLFINSFCLSEFIHLVNLLFPCLMFRLSSRDSKIRKTNCSLLWLHPPHPPPTPPSHHSPNTHKEVIFLVPFLWTGSRKANVGGQDWNAGNLQSYGWFTPAQRHWPTFVVPQQHRLPASTGTRISPILSPSPGWTVSSWMWMNLSGLLAVSRSPLNSHLSGK